MELLLSAAILLILLPISAISHSQLEPANEMAAAHLTKLLSTYIEALHIIHNHGVLDGYGHISVQNPDDPRTFFMMHQRAPALVSRLDDISEYRVSDAEPVDPDAPAAPLERYIHSETLKRYSHVNVVVHGHAEELVAFGVSSVRLKPVIHMAPFLGQEIPFFDIAKYYEPDDPQDLLVRNQRLGRALAAEFNRPLFASAASGGQGSSHDNNQTIVADKPYPIHNLVLMQSHGFTAVATDLTIATYQSIYAVVNARIQSEALKIQHAYTAQGAQGGNEIAGLDELQIKDSWATERMVVDKPWDLWVREVRVNPLYVNELNTWL